MHYCAWDRRWLACGNSCYAEKVLKKVHAKTHNTVNLH